MQRPRLSLFLATPGTGFKFALDAAENVVNHDRLPDVVHPELQAEVGVPGAEQVGDLRKAAPPGLGGRGAAQLPGGESETNV